MLNPLAIAATLCVNIAITEWLVRRTFLRHVGTALLVILVTAVTANLGVIPTGSGASGLYQAIFKYVAPLAIFLPLLEVNLRDILKAGLPMIGSFALGAAGTVVAVPLAMLAVGGKEAFGSLYPALGGMFVGTYTGGSVNFNAVALHYQVVREGAIYAGSVAVDNIITAVWMVATLAVPRFLSAATGPKKPDHNRDPGWVGADTSPVHPLDLAILGSLGFTSMAVSEGLADYLASHGIAVPSVLILTTLALALAQLPAVRRLRSVRPFGLFAIYLFLAVIGAFCDLSALGRIGPLGFTLFLFATLVVGIHGAVLFGVGRFFTKDWAVLSVASQANIGGPPSALALARSLGRSDLLLPAVLVGALGYGVGTYLGFAAAEWILVW